MEKVIYLKTATEVALNSTIELNGIKVKMTEDLVKDNPDLFKVVSEHPEYVCITQAASRDSDEQWYAIGEIGHIYKVDTVKATRFGFTYLCEFPKKIAIRDSGCKPSTKEEFDAQELLEEAKRRYPVGTRFRSATQSDSRIIISDGNFDQKANSGCIFCNRMLVYYKGRWAEIVKPLFKSKDGVDIYEDGEYWVVYTDEYLDKKWRWKINKSTNTFFGYSKNTKGIIRFAKKENAEKWLEYQVWLITEDGVKLYKNDVYYPVNVSCDSYPKLRYLGPVECFKEDCSVGYVKTFKFFSTKEAAQAYINSHKEKTLEDYENELCNKCFGDQYKSLKLIDSKLYYTKILDIIAKDINSEFSKETYWEIANAEDGYKSEDIDFPTKMWQATAFSSKEVCNKAIEIMGNKLKYIFE